MEAAKILDQNLPDGRFFSLMPPILTWAKNLSARRECKKSMILYYRNFALSITVNHLEQQEAYHGNQNEQGKYDHTGESDSTIFVDVRNGRKKPALCQMAKRAATAFHQANASYIRGGMQAPGHDPRGRQGTHAGADEPRQEISRSPAGRAERWKTCNRIHPWFWAGRSFFFLLGA